MSIFVYVGRNLSINLEHPIPIIADDLFMMWVGNSIKLFCTVRNKIICQWRFIVFLFLKETNSGHFIYKGAICRCRPCFCRRPPCARPTQIASRRERFGWFPYRDQMILWYISTSNYAVFQNTFLCLLKFSKHYFLLFIEILYFES